MSVRKAQGVKRKVTLRDGVPVRLLNEQLQEEIRLTGVEPNDCYVEIPAEFFEPAIEAALRRHFKTLKRDTQQTKEKLAFPIQVFLACHDIAFNVSRAEPLPLDFKPAYSTAPTGTCAILQAFTDYLDPHAKFTQREFILRWESIAGQDGGLIPLVDLADVARRVGAKAVGSKIGNLCDKRIEILIQQEIADREKIVSRWRSELSAFTSLSLHYIRCRV